MTVQRTLVTLSLVIATLSSPAWAAASAPTGDYYTQRLAELQHELSANISSPRAAATLYRAAALRDDLPDLDGLAKMFSSAAASPKAKGEVRQLAQYLLAQVELARGQVDATNQELTPLTFARDGWLVGGFDNEGGGGFSTAFGPETGPIDLKATYQGKETEISWRKVPTLGPNGVIPVSDLLRPRKNSTFYFLTTLDLATPEAVALHFGSSGATKIWVNGELVSSDSDDHPARFDQHAVGVALHKGVNTVLVKVSTLEEEPALFLRASSIKGRPLTRARFVAPSNEAPVRSATPTIQAGEVTPPTSPAVKLVQYEDIAAELKALADANAQNASILEDYATVLAERRSFDSKDQLHRREQEKVVALTPKDPRAQARLARYIEDDQNDRRRALEAALAADPSFVPARALLSSYYLERGFTRRAYDEAAQAAADDPTYYPAQLILMRALSAMSLDAKARHQELTLIDRFPDTPEVVLTAARAERAIGRMDKAMELYRQAIALRYDQREARMELSNMLLEDGDANSALEVLKQQLSLRPTSIPLGLRIADLLSFNGKPSEALAAYDHLAQLAPEDASVVTARGEHYLRQGNNRLALQDFNRALALKPQNPQLRELVRTVEPQENFAEPYLRDAIALAKQAHAQAAKTDDEAIVLANVDVVRVYPNGLASRVHQQVVQVLNDRGVDHSRVQGMQYSPGEQEIKVEQARVIKKDGTVVDAKTESDQELTDSWAGMYFDHRQHIVAFPSVEPGDVIEFTYRRDDVSQENMFADYFGDVDYLQSTNPTKDVEYVLIAPSERRIYSNEPALANVQHSEEKTTDGRQILRWRATEVPKIEPEPRMPGWANVAAYLHVSTFKEWNDVAKFWWGMVHDQLTVTPEVAKAADDAVAGIPASDIQGRVRAVYDYVVTKTRYVGLEFGIHGFKPYKVDRILARRFGDCKDKASLMYAMLKHLGIESNLVLLRMRNLGQLSSRPASLAVFNHCILYVPALHAFLDGTAEFSGSGELPGVDQGAQVLVVQNDGKTPSTLALTPVSAPAENVTVNTIKIAIAADGSAKLDGQSDVHGQAAQGYRRSYESETGRREKFEQSYARSYPGSHATVFDIGDPHAIEKPVQTHFSLSVPRLVHPNGNVMLFSPFGEPWRFAEANAPLSKRQYPVELGAPWRNEFSYTVKVPAGLAVSDAAVSLKKDSPFGSYEYEAKPSRDGLVVTGHVSFAVDKVTPDQYSAFRAFLEDIDRTFSRQFHLAPVTASNAPEASR